MSRSNSTKVELLPRLADYAARLSVSEIRRRFERGQETTARQVCRLRTAKYRSDLISTGHQLIRLQRCKLLSRLRLRTVDKRPQLIASVRPVARVRRIQSILQLTIKTVSDSLCEVEAIDEYD